MFEAIITSIADICSSALWPLAVIILAVMFYGVIKEKFADLIEYDYANRVFKFGQAVTDRLEREEVTEQSVKAALLASKEEKASPLPWDKPASLFWIGNDMMWVQDMIYRGAPPKRVLEGLFHVKQYAVQLGVWPQIKSVLDPAISVIVDLSGTTNPKKYIGFYEYVANSVNTAKLEVSAILTKKEPKFKKKRAQ